MNMSPEKIVLGKTILRSGWPTFVRFRSRQDSIEKFTTYEDYLDSQITPQDRPFEDSLFARLFSKFIVENEHKDTKTIKNLLNPYELCFFFTSLSHCLKLTSQTGLRLHWQTLIDDGCYPAIYQDRFYLEEDELARQLVEIGCRKGEAPALRCRYWLHEIQPFKASLVATFPIHIIFC